MRLIVSSLVGKCEISPLERKHNFLHTRPNTTSPLMSKHNFLRQWKKHASSEEVYIFHNSNEKRFFSTLRKISVALTGLCCNKIRTRRIFIIYPLQCGPIESERLLSAVSHFLALIRTTYPKNENQTAWH